MAFEKGTATSTFDLLDKLATFMANQSGWTLRSDIGQYDKVYYSAGTDGKKDIYIRQRLGPVETFIRGADQYDYGNGDTGFINFQAYGYFPEDGDVCAGASEIGQLGPRFLWTPGNTDFKLYHQDILSQQPGGSPHVIYGDPTNEQEPPETIIDENGLVRRRWTYNPTSLPTKTDLYYSGEKKFAFDGHRYLYICDLADTSRALKRYSLQGKGGYQVGFSSYTTHIGVRNMPWYPIYMEYFEDRRTREEYLFVAGDIETNFAKINLKSGLITYLASADWPDRWGTTGLFTGGWYTQEQSARSACWNGGRYIYILRGGVYAGGSYDKFESPDWGVYDIYNDTWRTTTDPEDPEFRGIPREPVDYSLGGKKNLLFVNKALSGFEYDRIYLVGDNTGKLLYMELGDNGLPHIDGGYESGFWKEQGREVAASWPLTSYQGYLFLSRSNRVFYGPTRQFGIINGIYETFPSSPARNLPYTDLKEEDSVHWEFTDECYFPQASGSLGESSYAYVDGYACRVRTSISSNTEYVFIADDDRIIVATKSDSEWSVAYMGAFESVHAETPYGELLEDVSSGFSKKIKLTNVSGTFEEGEEYFIMDSTGSSYNSYCEILDKTNTFVNGEAVRVLKVEDNTLTVSLKADYKAGSKIALDPQPVGLFFWETEKFQTTNIYNSEYDDFSGTDDPSAQVHACIPDSVLGEYCIVAGEYGEGWYVKQGTRGKLKGVYTGDSYEETFVSIGDNVYYAIKPPDYYYSLLIGPVNS